MLFNQPCLFSSINIIFEGFLLIFFAIVVQKWVLKNIPILIKATEQNHTLSMTKIAKIG